jgi:hypothetical protein
MTDDKMTSEKNDPNEILTVVDLKKDLVVKLEIAQSKLARARFLMEEIHELASKALHD